MIDIHHPYWRFAERWNGRLAMVGVISLLLIKCLSQFLAAFQQQQHTAMYFQLYFNDTPSSTINITTTRLQRSCRVWIFCDCRNNCRFFGVDMINFTEIYQMVFMMVVGVVMATTMFMTMMSYMMED